MRKQDFEVFIEKFEPIMTDDGIKLFETFGEDYEVIKQTKPNCIWTLIEGDSGKWYISPGLHLVNRVNYIITKKPWIDYTKQRDYLY